MFKKENFSLIGSLAKTHGVHGALILKLTGLNPEDIPDIESVFINVDGLMVPYFISQLSDRDQSSMIIMFDDIDSKDKAEEFTGCEIFVQADLLNKSAGKHKIINDITGYKVADKKYGDIGQIKDIINIHNNPLLRVRSGKQEYLIPFHNDFVVDKNHKLKTIYTCLPNGLLDI